MDALLGHIDRMNTDEAELFSTVYAAWNDLLLDGRPQNEEAIIAEVYGWHKSKARFSRPDILGRIAWMRDNNYVPKGLRPRTQDLPGTEDGARP